MGVGKAGVLGDDLDPVCAAHEYLLRARKADLPEPFSKTATCARPNMPGQAAAAHAGTRGEFVKGRHETGIGTQRFEDLGGPAIGR